MASASMPNNALSSKRDMVSASAANACWSLLKKIFSSKKNMHGMITGNRLIYITGGVRSGKSRYAQEIALALSDHPVYLATARIWDEDFKERVQRHQNDRDERWTNLEEEKHFVALPLDNRVVVIDCVTLWLTNFFTDTKNDIQQCLSAVEQEIHSLKQRPGVFIIISNEIGMGMHADTEIGRKFADLQGWANQLIAKQADEAVFMVSGRPIKL
jgi:adenosylcobinamide kinase/adenosylcobinamide-phosphate guanylyltransferase